jgi:hypothetical protein
LVNPVGDFGLYGHLARTGWECPLVNAQTNRRLPQFEWLWSCDFPDANLGLACGELAKGRGKLGPRGKKKHLWCGVFGTTIIKGPRVAWKPRTVHLPVDVQRRIPR